MHVVISSLKKSLDEMSKVPDLEPKILADLYKSQKYSHALQQESNL